MRIGFIQSEGEDSSEAVLGYAEPANEEDEDEDGRLLIWLGGVLVDFFLVYGFIAVVRDLIYYLRAW